MKLSEWVRYGTSKFTNEKRKTIPIQYPTKIYKYTYNKYLA